MKNLTIGSDVRRVSFLFLAALSLIYGGYNLGRSLLGPKQGEDFAQYYVTARMVLDGAGSRIYDHGADYQARAARYGVNGVVIEGREVRDVMTYAYPPFVAVFMVPFASLPYREARYVFFFTSLLAALLVIPLLFTSRQEVERKELIGIGLLAVCAFFPLYYTLYMGQINALLFLFCALTLYAARKEIAWLAGLFLALSVLIKIFPLVLVPFFLMKRQYRVVGATLAWIAVLFALSLILFDMDLWRTFIGDVLPLQYSGGAWVRNQGYVGFLTRMLTRNPYTEPVREDPILARRLSAVLGALTLGVAILCTRRSDDLGTARYDVEFGSYFVAALLALAKSYEHLGIFLLFSYLYLFEYLMYRRQKGHRLLFLVMVSFCVWAFILTDGSEYLRLPWHAWANGVISAKFFATLLLFGCNVWILARRKDSGLLMRADFTPSRRLNEMGSAPI